MSKDHISCQTDRMSTGDIAQGHQKVDHKGRGIGMTLLIEGTGMIVMLIGQTTVIMIN